MLPTYENQLIKMREAITNDAGELLRISMDPSVMEYYGGNPVHDLSSAEEEIKWFINLPTTDSGARWVIVDKAVCGSGKNPRAVLVEVLLWRD